MVALSTLGSPPLGAFAVPGEKMMLGGENSAATDLLTDGEVSKTFFLAPVRCNAPRATF